MQFVGIEKDIDLLLSEYTKKQPQKTELCYKTDDEGIIAIITSLRNNGVNIGKFIFEAFENWEYILNKMADKLPLYIQENLKGYEIKKEV